MYCNFKCFLKKDIFAYLQFSPITCLTSESVSGFECQLECNEGYAVYGEEKRICGEGGNWINFLTGTNLFCKMFLI